MKTKINKTTESFLKYGGYTGDGKYYTTTHGSRHYNNTIMVVVTITTPFSKTSDAETNTSFAS